MTGMPAEERRAIRFGEFHLDLRSGELSKGSVRLRLQEKPLRILGLLLGRPGDVVSRDELRQALWPADTFVGFDGGLNTAVNKLRVALDDSAESPRFVETVGRRGYRFIGPVEPLTAFEESPDSARPKRWRAVLTSRWLLALVALIVTGCGFWAAWTALRPPAPAERMPRSIAVLPFQSLNQGDDDETLGRRLADALILRLGNLRRVVVRPLSAAQKHDGPLRDPIAAGREQQVEAVLDARFQRVGERLRVTARLLRVSDGEQLWAGTFDEHVATDPFTLQDALSAKVAQTLVPQLTGEERRLLLRHETNDAQAYQSYELGRYFWNKRTPEAIRKARDHFQQAITRDPNYARAYAGLANVWITLSDYEVTPAHEAYPRAKEAATKAMVLDDTLADAQTALAMVSASYDWDWDVADASFASAITLDPNYATARQWYAEYLAAMGRGKEALDQIHLAQGLDPSSLIIRADEAWLLYFARDYDRMIAQSKRVIAMEPHFGEVYAYLARAYEQKGMYREAMDAFQERATLMGYNTPHGEAIRTSAILNAEDYWRKRAAIERVPGSATASEFDLAEALAQLGEIDEALALLERCYAARKYELMYLKVHPNLDGLRSDPRFVELMRRMGLG